MQKHISLWVDVLLAVAGVLAVCYAAFAIYVPAGWVLVGAVLLAVAYVRRVLAINRGDE